VHSGRIFKLFSVVLAFEKFVLCQSVLLSVPSGIESLDPLNESLKPSFLKQSQTPGKVEQTTRKFGVGIL